VQSACSNRMPGSIVQASPGGTSPRTIKYNQLLITNTFEAIKPKPDELEVGCQGEEDEGPQGLGGDQDQLQGGQGQGLDGQEGRVADGADHEMGEENEWVKGATNLTMTDIGVSWPTWKRKGKKPE
jgi:hypothetical protein